MEQDLYINLREAYSTYLQKFKGRKILYNLAIGAIFQEKSKTKKLCLTIVREIFKDENDIYFIFFNDKEISEKLLLLLTKGIKEEIEFDTFLLKFFSISKIFEFIYQISKYYSFLFSAYKEDYWGEFIELFLFEKLFKKEYLNKLLDMVGLTQIQITYDNFIELIKNKYDEKKGFNEEFWKIFTTPKEKITEKKDEISSKSKEDNSGLNKEINGNNQLENDRSSETTKNGKGQTIKQENERNNKENIYLGENFENNNEINNQSKDEIILSNIDADTIEKINSQENKNITALEYLKDIFQKHQKLSYIPILNEKIKKNKKFTFNDVGYYNENYFDLKYKIIDKTLSILINDKLCLDTKMGDKRKYGYFYYNYENYNLEALYSTINPVDLFSYCQIKDLIDDYKSPKIKVQNLYTKSRAMTLEYYINISVFFEKYNVKPYPRIIFPLGKSIRRKDLLNEVELDGAFLVEKKFSIKDNDFPFIFQNFLSCNGSKNIYKLNFTTNFNGGVFEENDLCLLEIKTKFPENLKYRNNETTFPTFPEVIENMLNKMIIFEQLFKFLGVNYKRIRLILFYDLVKTTNYAKVIQTTLKKFLDNNQEISYLDKINFQVIYMNASYFVESLRTNAEVIKNIKAELNNLKIDMNKKDEKIEKLCNDNKELQIANKEFQTANKKLQIANKKLQIANYNFMKKIEFQNRDIENLKIDNKSLRKKFEMLEKMIKTKKTTNEDDDSEANE